MNPTLRLCLLASLIGALCPASAHALCLKISEVFYDAVGSDNGQGFVEIYGPASLLLDGYRLEAVNGSGGAVGPVLTLSGSVPGDGFFVLADDDAGSTSVPEADLLLNFDFQNGPDSIVLRAPDDSIVDALGYGVFAAGDVFAGEGSPAPDPPAGQSLARVFANIDTNDNAADFVALAAPTPGTAALALPEPLPAVLVAVSLFCVSACRRRRTKT